METTANDLDRELRHDGKTVKGAARDAARQAGVAAPTFASIARQPGFDADKLAFFLLDPHPKMPNMALTRREASDLAAYIATLGRPH